MTTLSARLSIAFVAMCLVGCTSEPPQGGASHLDELPEREPDRVETPDSSAGPFERMRHVRLLEGDYPIGHLTAVALHPNRDLIAVADHLNGQIHVFDGEGNRVALLGRGGQGPGEYVRITDVLWLSDGRLVVGDWTPSRLSIYRDDLTLDTTVVLPPGARPFALREAPEGHLLVTLGTIVDQDRLAEVSAEGEFLRSYFRPDPDPAAVPYWAAILNEVADAGRVGVAVATNLRHVVYILDQKGGRVDSIIEPPDSWQPAVEPELGAFAGARQVAFFEEYLPGVTKISRVDWVSDSTLMVTYARFKPEERDRWHSEDYGVRFFKGSTAVSAEFPIPGRMLAVKDDDVWFVEHEPGTWEETDGWVLGIYRLAVH